MILLIVQDTRRVSCLKRIAGEGGGGKGMKLKKLGKQKFGRETACTANAAREAKPFRSTPFMKKEDL